MFNCTPDHLLPAVRQELEALLDVRAAGALLCPACLPALHAPCLPSGPSCRHTLHPCRCWCCPLPAPTAAAPAPLPLLQVGETLLEGYIRPGCTQLTVNALMTQQRLQELKVRAVGALPCRAHAS